MPETSEINKILIELQEELEKIKTAAELIEVAKNSNDKILKDSINAFNEIMNSSEENIEKLSNNAQKTISESQGVFLKSIDAANKTIIDTQDTFKKGFEKIREKADILLKESKEMIDLTQKFTDLTIKESKELNRSSQDLIQATNELLDEIKKINFPVKFEKMDLTLSGLSTSIQNIFGRFETFERTFNENLKNEQKEISKKIDETLEEINLKFKKVKNRTNSILILNWIVIILFALFFYKMYFL